MVSALSGVMRILVLGIVPLHPGAAKYYRERGYPLSSQEAAK